MGRIKWYIGDELDLELGLSEKTENERTTNCIDYLQHIIKFFYY